MFPGTRSSVKSDLHVAHPLVEATTNEHHVVVRHQLKSCIGVEQNHLCVLLGPLHVRCVQHLKNTQVYPCTVSEEPLQLGVAYIILYTFARSAV